MAASASEKRTVPRAGVQLPQRERMSRSDHRGAATSSAAAVFRDERRYGALELAAVEREQRGAPCFGAAIFRRAQDYVFAVKLSAWLSGYDAQGAFDAPERDKLAVGVLHHAALEKLRTVLTHPVRALVGQTQSCLAAHAPGRDGLYGAIGFHAYAEEFHGTVAERDGYAVIQDCGISALVAQAISSPYLFAAFKGPGCHKTCQKYQSPEYEPVGDCRDTDSRAAQHKKFHMI